MPLFHQNIVPRLNRLLSRENIGSADRRMFALEDGVMRAGLSELSEAEQEAMASLPRAIRFALKGAVTAAIDEGAEVNLVWAPAYDAEIQIWDARSVTVEGQPTAHVVTILVRSPYPNASSTSQGS